MTSERERKVHDRIAAGFTPRPAEELEQDVRSMVLSPAVATHGTVWRRVLVILAAAGLLVGAMAVTYGVVGRSNHPSTPARVALEPSRTKQVEPAGGTEATSTHRIAGTTTRSPMNGLTARMAPYTTLAGLTENADAIVRGTVDSVRYIAHGYLPQTIYTVRVTRSWSPAVKQGDTITVCRDGGMWSRADMMRFSGRLKKRPSSADEAAKSPSLMDGQPLPKIGEDAIYFLVHSDADWKRWTGVPDLYVVDGSVQGEVYIKDGIAQRFWPTGFGPDFLGSKDVSVLEDEISAAPKKSGN